VIRRKHPEVDLKRTYRKTLGKGIGLSALLHLLLFTSVPTLEIATLPLRRERVVIELENIPETIQAIPPRSLSPFSWEVVIDTLPQVARELPPVEVITEFATEGEEEVVEFWMLEKKPRVLKRVLPAYPNRARQEMIEGKVFVRVLVNIEGRVERVERVTGPEIFHGAVTEAARQWEFTPAIQNEHPVKVWVSLPFSFELVDPEAQP
jgi:TonB family protein